MAASSSLRLPWAGHFSKKERELTTSFAQHSAGRYYRQFTEDREKLPQVFCGHRPAR